MQNEMSLEIMYLSELNLTDLSSIDGGDFPWKKLWDAASKAVTAWDLAEISGEVYSGMRVPKPVTGGWAPAYMWNNIQHHRPWLLYDVALIQ